MNHLTEQDIRERIEYLVKDVKNTDATNAQLMTMVYIQLAYTFGDINSQTKNAMLNEYLSMLRN